MSKCDCDKKAIYWNEFNKVVQCHACGLIYEPSRYEPKEGDEVWYIKTFDEKDFYKQLDKPAIFRDLVTRVENRVWTYDYKGDLNGESHNPYILYTTKEEVEQALKDIKGDKDE